MQRALVGACFAGALLLAAAAQAQQVPTEEAAVRAAVSQYVESAATGSGEPLRAVFHPSLFLMWVRDGVLVTRTGEEYMAGFRGTPAADEAQRKRTIELVDVTGTAAIAKVVLDYPSVCYTDYFTLLKIGGEWKIMNKTFHAEPRASG